MKGAGYIHLLLALGFSIGSSANLFGQEKSITHSNQQWIQYLCQIHLSERWNLSGDAGYRWQDGLNQRYQYVLRSSFSYKTNGVLQIGGGLAYSGTYGDEGLSAVEFRPFQDLSIKSEYHFFDLSQRFRIEERIFNPVINGRIESPNEFNFRLRYSLSANIPLCTLSQKRPEAKLSFTIGDEIFINAGKAIVTNVFDKNRFIMGPALQWNKSISFAFSWSNQYSSTEDPSVYRRTQVVWLQIKQQIFARPKTELQ